MKNRSLAWLGPLVCGLSVLAAAGTGPQATQSSASGSAKPSLQELKAEGPLRSKYREQLRQASTDERPQANLAAFHEVVAPILREACVQCHGPDNKEGNIRIDTLNPDLVHGADVDWWLEVLAVLSNGEMPPPDDSELVDADRSQVVQWLSNEIQLASQIRRSERGHSSFRRMTRYETNYALQDLLGLPYDFTQDLPPETHSEDGFENSSEMLQMSVMQFETYRQLARAALGKATVVGPRPEMIYYCLPMSAVADKIQTGRDTPVNLRNTHFLDLETGQGFPSSFRYHNAKQSHLPSEGRLKTPPMDSTVLVLPPGRDQRIDLSDQLPESGILRVRIRAARSEIQDPSPPALRMKFGYQPSNDSRTSMRVEQPDVPIVTGSDQPQFYQWDIPLTEIPRNPYRGVTQLGDLPNPTEYLILENIYSGRGSASAGSIQIDYIEVSTPVYQQWPPETHIRIFHPSENQVDEPAYAREILSRFLPRAWRRAITAEELEKPLSLFKQLRPQCQDFQEAMLEVLATVLASPKFLYVVQEAAQPEVAAQAGEPGSTVDGLAAMGPLSDYELATRLSMFLWCSVPDQELLRLAASGKLNTPEELTQQTQRMLADPRSQRFAKHFVRQWLGMQLLDYLDVEQESYPDFDLELKAAMQQEPIAFFQEMLANNRSVLDFLHSDYTLANERLAQHYGLPDVYGPHFRLVQLKPGDRRGGLMTQAGLLAMNSDGKDSHPLKRGIWMLERLLNDPPPPPPASVPEIDLTDPEIAKLTLKQRIEEHRNNAACMSCHAKIDPWGIAFENFDAVGSWRDTIGGAPVDATSRLFNNQPLEGVEGLKRFLLVNRQDQFCRSLTHKLTTFALGRPLSFADRSGVDQITAEVRNADDGLSTLVTAIVTSELFQSK